jgi:hypothetical protein
MYELVYGNGGHGGPHKDMEEAVRVAYNLLRGSRSERVIYVVPRDAPRYELRYAVRTVTKEEACKPEYCI